MKAGRTVRLSLLVALCLLLGAATTVAIAWMCHLFHAKGETVLGLRDSAAGAHGWPKWVTDSRSPPYSIVVVRAWGWEEERVFAGSPRSTLVDQAHTLRSGWPLLAFWQGECDPDDYHLKPLTEGWAWPGGRRGLQYVAGFGAQEPDWIGAVNARWYIPVRGSNRTLTVVCLPTALLPLGFAADTAFYAAAWWLLLFMPLPLYRAGRRRFRVSRGMCGSCGYDLKGLTGGACPECGLAAVARGVA